MFFQFLFGQSRTAQGAEAPQQADASAVSTPAGSERSPAGGDTAQARQGASQESGQDSGKNAPG